MFEHATPTFFTAFFAGLLSFVSPCVLPLIPGYLSYISGVTLDDMQGTGSAGAAATGGAGARSGSGRTGSPSSTRAMVSRQISAGSPPPLVPVRGVLSS